MRRDLIGAGLVGVVVSAMVVTLAFVGARQALLGQQAQLSTVAQAAPQAYSPDAPVARRNLRRHLRRNLSYSGRRHLRRNFRRHLSYGGRRNFRRNIRRNHRRNFNLVMRRWDAGRTYRRNF